MVWARWLGARRVVFPRKPYDHVVDNMIVWFSETSTSLLGARRSGTGLRAPGTGLRAPGTPSATRAQSATGPPYLSPALFGLPSNNVDSTTVVRVRATPGIRRSLLSDSPSSSMVATRTLTTNASSPATV